MLHSRIVEQTGGSHGVRDIGLLESAVHRPQSAFAGQELYKGIFLKSAVLLESIVKNHAFIDGNKRIGFVATSRFLFINGYEMMATNKDVVNFVLKVAESKVELLTMSAWFKKHSKKLRKVA